MSPTTKPTTGSLNVNVAVNAALTGSVASVVMTTVGAVLSPPDPGPTLGPNSSRRRLSTAHLTHTQSAAQQQPGGQLEQQVHGEEGEHRGSWKQKQRLHISV